MKKIFFITIFLIFSLIQKSYGYSNDPKQFISEIVEEAKAILVESNTKEFKTKKLSEMALKTVDIEGVAYYSIGKYRKVDFGTDTFMVSASPHDIYHVRWGSKNSECARFSFQSASHKKHVSEELQEPKLRGRETRSAREKRMRVERTLSLTLYLDRWIMMWRSRCLEWLSIC